MKYTRDDVIIWPDDERLKGSVGKACYIGKRPSYVLADANKGNFEMILDKVRGEFGEGATFKVHNSGSSFESPFLILKKEPERKIVPYDFSLKEDRDALMGKRIISTSGDLIVTAFAFWSDRGWLLQVDSEFGYDSDFVLGEFVFADTGKPVGKEVFE